jgi:hypothetical protein
MVMSILLGLTAILRRDVTRHRAWMMRGYAIGLGAGTQVLTEWAGTFITSLPDDLNKALAMGAAWVINLAIAEWAIRRGRARINRNNQLDERKSVFHVDMQPIERQG